jgi:esterase/lipase
MKNSSRKRSIFRLLRRLLAMGVLIILFLVGILWLWPIPLAELAPHRPAPITVDEYWESLRKADEDPALSEVGHSIRIPARDSNRALVVMVHGLTNCPEQFRPFAETLSEETGCEIIIPRIPFHGLADRMNRETAELSGEVMVKYAEDIGRIVDDAKAGGGSVTVMGLSLGGTITAWLAQHYPIDHAVLISPVLGVFNWQGTLNPPVVNLTRLRKQDFQWWHPDLKENNPGPNYAYPQYSIYSIGQILRVAMYVQHEASTTRPCCDAITIVTNESDEAVSRTRDRSPGRAAGGPTTACTCEATPFQRNLRSTTTSSTRTR